MRDRGAKRQLRLRNEKVAGQILGKTYEKMTMLQTVKRIVGSRVPLKRTIFEHCGRIDPLRNGKQQKLVM